MKKLFPLALVASLMIPAFAQDEDRTMDEKSDSEAVVRTERQRESAVWPAFFAVCEFPASPDVLGLRLTFPFSTKQESITGFDLGLWGRSLYFEGLQMSILRNDVKDDMSGFQFGLYNSVGGGQLLGLQIGLFNEANSFRGLQAGLVNIAGESEGFQIGLINRCETMSGYQIGLINVIRDAELSFFPIINIGW